MDPNKLLECSAQGIQQDMANVLLGLSAALQLHGIFHCIRSPDAFQTMVTDPSQCRLGIPLIFQLENVEKTEVK